MTMSMYSSYTPEDFNNEEDIFGKSRRRASPDLIGRYLMSNPGIFWEFSTSLLTNLHLIT